MNAFPASMRPAAGLSLSGSLGRTNHPPRIMAVLRASSLSSAGRGVHGALEGAGVEGGSCAEEEAVRK